MTSLHNSNEVQGHLDLKLDLWAKITDLLAAEGIEDRTGVAIGIVNLLEVESQESYLTRKDAAQLQAQLTEVTDAAHALGGKGPEGDFELHNEFVKRDRRIRNLIRRCARTS